MTLQLPDPQQAVIDTLLEDLADSMARAQVLQRQIAFTALTFLGIPQEDWHNYEVGMASPTVVRKRNNIREEATDE